MAPNSKLQAVLRSSMVTRGWHNAARAMEFASRFHTGMRKDGLTPEFAHQIAIAGYAHTLIPSLLHPEETFCAIFLHDLVEDYGKQVSLQAVSDRFGRKVGDAVGRLTKEVNGIKKPYEMYFGELAECPIASFVKGGDRIHNFQSMIGVFTYPKQREYLDEGRRWFMPMLKQARQVFTEQNEAYENVKFVLGSQMAMIEAIHAAAAAPSEEAAAEGALTPRL